jgi:acetyl-CoA acetyltransferase
LQDVVIAGVGMTNFGKFYDRTIRSLAEEAVAQALTDAGATASDIGAVYFANGAAGIMTGQEMIRGQAALRDTGLLGVPLVNVENACASASSAVHLAWLAVAAGEVDVALAVGAEKLTHPDKARALEAISTAVDLEGMPDVLGEDNDGDGDGTSGSRFMEIYAGLAREYMDRSGATKRDLAEVAAKASRHGALNPRAQFRTPRSADEVLGSRLIAEPLTLLMCSPIGDGAAALVLCSRDFADRLETDPVVIRASVLVSGNDGTPPAAERAARRAYERAGLGPGDLDLVELHDAAAPAELTLYEELGLAEEGGGARLLASGATALGGRLPVNTSGGLLSKGHPIGATGAAQLVELTEQLRGTAGDRQVPGARIGLAENGGGFLGSDAAAAAVHILEREDRS